jgi:transposase InsO family protein
MVVVDDYSRFVTPFLLKFKSDVLRDYKLYSQLAATKHRCNIAALRSDNGGEFTSHAFEGLLQSQGTMHQLTTPYHPQQNGVAERMNGTLMGTTRALLLHSGTPHRYWGEALLTAAYLRNRTPTRALGGKTPLLLWDGNLNPSPNPLPLRV